MTRQEKRQVLLEWVAWFVRSDLVSEWWLGDPLGLVLARLKDLE